MISSNLYDVATNDYSSIFCEIDKALQKVSTSVYNEKRYAIKCFNKFFYEDLLILKDVLQTKIHCDSCLSSYPLSLLLSHIRTITNKINK